MERENSDLGKEFYQFPFFTEMAKNLEKKEEDWHLCYGPKNVGKVGSLSAAALHYQLMWDLQLGSWACSKYRQVDMHYE